MATDYTGTPASMIALMQASRQRLAHKVTIDGTDRSDNVISINREWSWGQACQVCTLELTTSAGGYSPDSKVEVWEGYNDGIYKTFTGMVDVIEQSGPPYVLKLRCRDMLKRVVDNFLADNSDETFKTPYHTFNNIQAETAIQWLLDNSYAHTWTTASDITYSLATSSYTVGNPTSHTGESGYAGYDVNLMSAMDVVNEISKSVSFYMLAWQRKIYWATYNTASTAIITENAPGWNFTNNDSYGDIIKVNSKTASDERLRNKIVVYGYGGLKPSVPYDPTYGIYEQDSAYRPAGYRQTAIVTSLMYDTQGLVDWAANDIYTKLSIATEYISLTVLGNPIVRLGDPANVVITNAGELNTNALYYIYGLRTHMGVNPASYTTQVTLSKNNGGQ